MLGRKQAVHNDQWVRRFQDIEKYVSQDEVDHMVDVAVDDIRLKTKGLNVAYGWSGGKDSIALQFVMDQAGIDQAMFARSNLEYPAFIQWIEKYKPAGLKTVNTGQDLHWLALNPSMLFPRDSKTAAKWYRMIQHKAQEWYYKRNKLDAIILGRRTADGNYTGKQGQNIYTNKQGITRYSPLRDWKHEHVLGLIHYYRLPLPPIYDWPNGFKVGTGPWAARKYTQSVKQGWREVYSIDPSIVEQAAEYIITARMFLLEGAS